MSTATYHILTLFPEVVDMCLHSSILGRAAEQGLIAFDTVNIRDHTLDKHKKVDDYTYGGGAGMLMCPQPVYDAWAHVRQGIGGDITPRTIYVTPAGRLFDQAMARELSGERELIFLCGHYEGIDERALEEIGAEEVSIGDYVLTGGELPALVMIDAIARLIPGVLHNEDSPLDESIESGLLEYPQYSRPAVWHDKPVPEVLLSGHHANIEKWRREQSLARTKKRRPDLYEAFMRGRNTGDG